MDVMNDKIDMSLARARVPYVLVAAILVLIRVSDSAKAFTKSVVIPFKDILGEGLGYSIVPLYLPGGILVFVVLITFFFHKMSVKELGKAFSISRH